MESGPAPEPDDVTGLLHRWAEGDAQALDRLVPLVYDELRRLARHVLRDEAPGTALQRTALVHELYLKLVAQDRAEWRDRQQFFGIAVKLMRRLIVDDARHRLASKRGAGATHLPIDAARDQAEDGRETTLAVDAALSRFAEIDPERSRIVELRYFGGLDLAEIADLLGVSRTTVKRHWTVARLWLHRELGDGPFGPAFPRTQEKAERD